MTEKVFLTAQWKHLLMVNYEVDKQILLPYLPAKTELDLYAGSCLLSIVGFQFLNTKVRGIGFPFHKHFVEINLRFYVKHKENNIWKRAVVFVKEIVPKFMIAYIANVIYNEKYICLPTNCKYGEKDSTQYIQYNWKYKEAWHSISASFIGLPQPILLNSSEEFITEHYWGYSKKHDNETVEYGVEHPRWQILPISNFDIQCDFKNLYGEAFQFLQTAKPFSVLLANGSDVIVRKRKKI